MEPIMDNKECRLFALLDRLGKPFDYCVVNAGADAPSIKKQWHLADTRKVVFTGTKQQCYYERSKLRAQIFEGLGLPKFKSSAIVKVRRAPAKFVEHSDPGASET